MFSQSFLFEWQALYYNSNSDGFTSQQKDWVHENIKIIVNNLSQLVDGLLEMEFSEDPDSFHYELNLYPILNFVEAIFDKDQCEHIIKLSFNEFDSNSSQYLCDVLYTCMLKIIWYKRILKNISHIKLYQPICDDCIIMIKTWEEFANTQLEILQQNDKFQKEYNICKGFMTRNLL